MSTRGYCGIGMENPKKGVNLGTLWRSAHCLGAQFIFTINHRYRTEASDTTKAARHIPYFHYETWEDFEKHIPADCKLVGVEIHDRAIQLATFVHPERAVYLLGPEDGSLSEEAVTRCDAIVRFPSTYCLNVAVAGSIVLYDRSTKG